MLPKPGQFKAKRFKKINGRPKGCEGIFSYEQNVTRKRKVKNNNNNNETKIKHLVFYFLAKC